MATGGGIKAIRSVIQYTKRIGPFKLWRAVTSKNACKACAFGTGGQNGGLKNEARRGIEICNKNIQAHLSDIRKGIPNTVFFEKSIDALSQLSHKELEDLGRITTPLYKKPGEQHYTPITYDKALDILQGKLKKSDPQRSFFYASGRSSNEAAFLLQLFARLYGCNHVNNCSYYCHQASGVGLQSTLGTSTATVEYEDLYLADNIVVWGANPASNHPRFVKTLIHCRRRGGKVIIINPAKEPGLVRFASPSDVWSMIKGGESIASHYYQPNIGGDFALACGIAKHIVSQHLYNKTFIAEYTQGFESFRQHIDRLSWEDICETSGISREEIKQLAKLYTHSKNTIFAWGMGLTHHEQGVNNIQALSALTLLKGQVGQPGSGLLPLRGHSNIQGTGSMGFTPTLKKAVFEQLEKQLNIDLPQSTGMDTMSCMEAAHRKEMDVALLLGGNLFAANPDSAFTEQALDSIGFKCFISPTLNISHVKAVSQECLILPIRVRDEEKQATTQESMFNFVRMSDGGIDRFSGLHSEVELISELGKRVIPTEVFDFSPFQKHQTIRETIANVIPGFKHLGDIDQSKKEFHIDQRILHQPQFQTDSGKAHFPLYEHNDFTHVKRNCRNLSSPSSQPSNLSSSKEQHSQSNASQKHSSQKHSSQGHYNLTSVRSEGQFNSIIFHNYDAYRDQTERNIVLMNKDDMKKEKLKINDFVDISSDTGTLQQFKARPFDIKPGNIMVYYPEANALIPRHVDPKSRTPSFKSVKVHLETSANE